MQSKVSLFHYEVEDYTATNASLSSSLGLASADKHVSSVLLFAPKVIDFWISQFIRLCSARFHLGVGVHRMDFCIIISIYNLFKSTRDGSHHTPCGNDSYFLLKPKILQMGALI